MTREEMKKYIAWFCDPTNSGNCSECPDNREMDDWQGRKPCGQWNCWVDCHCRKTE